MHTLHISYIYIYIYIVTFKKPTIIVSSQAGQKSGR